jgi:hypothetical protein
LFGSNTGAGRLLCLFILVTLSFFFFSQLECEVPVLVISHDPLLLDVLEDFLVNLLNSLESHDVSQDIFHVVTQSSVFIQLLVGTFLRICNEHLPQLHVE